MNKLTYIEIFNREGNKKAWNAFMNKFHSIKKKNKILAYLYWVMACVLFGFMAIIGWLASLRLVFKDVRFSPHYLRVVIEENRMTTKEANEYLSEKLLEYKNSLSFGNFFPKERDSIDATFEILFNKYKLPAPTDQKHEEIISGISTLHTSVDKVVTYTELQQQKEEAEIMREQSLREEQEKRITTAHNREKGKKLTSFESALSERQIKILTDYCNRILVFDRDIEIQEMKDILLCVHPKPLRVRINKFVAFLFTELANKKLICKTWKSVAERYKCFASADNKILNSNDLYMANQTSGLMDQKAYELIEECIIKIVSCSK